MFSAICVLGYALFAPAALFSMVAAQQGNPCGPGTGFVSAMKENTFLSPNFPQTYPINLNCRYTIRTPPGFTTVIRVNVFSTERLHDFLQLSGNGFDEKWSGEKTSEMVIFAKGDIYVHFHSDSSVVGTGFNVSYFLQPITDSSACGTANRKATTSEQFILSPSYPQQYPNDVECLFYIESTSDFTCVLKINDFSTEQSKDVLVISSDDSATKSLSGTRASDVIFHSKSDIFLSFISNHVNVFNGFNISYFLERSVINTPRTCRPTEHLATTTKQFISTPNFPSKYPNNFRCSWVILTPSNSSILLRTVTFRTEYHHDRLTVADGDNSVKWHGTVAPGNAFYSSPGKSVILEFSSDVSTSEMGFNISYWLASSHDDPPTTTAVSHSCGLFFADDVNRVFTSPLFPASYPNSLRCEYTIVSNLSEDISIETHDFSVHSSDTFMIHSGSESVAWNGYMSYAVYTASSPIHIEFITDSSITSKGFILHYCTGGCFKTNDTLKIVLGAGLPVVLIIIIVGIIYCYCRRRRRSGTPAHVVTAQYPVANETDVVPHTPESLTMTGAPMNPPSYEDFISNPDQFEMMKQLPPSYEVVIHSTQV